MHGLCSGVNAIIHLGVDQKTFKPLRGSCLVPKHNTVMVRLCQVLAELS